MSLTIERPICHGPVCKTLCESLPCNFASGISTVQNQIGFVSAWEESHGREMTDQEIRLGLEQLRIIRELE